MTQRTAHIRISVTAKALKRLLEMSDEYGLTLQQACEEALHDWVRRKEDHDYDCRYESLDW